MDMLGRRSNIAATVYLVGGTSAILNTWRASTRDIDLRIEPESATGTAGDAIASIKQDLDIGIEFASPLDFLPEMPGWRERSPFVEEVGGLTFRHFDSTARRSQRCGRVRRSSGLT
jgi:hypothetical protein